MAKPNSRPTQRRAGEKELRRILFDLINHSENPARILELYFWSRDKTVVTVVRALVAMDGAAKESLAAFIGWAEDPETISAKLDCSGRLTMSAPKVSGAFGSAKYLTEILRKRKERRKPTIRVEKQRAA